MKLADMHCDTISAMLKKRRLGDFVSLRENDLHVDLNKLIKGDYLLQNFALFVKLEAVENPLEEVLQMADLYYEELERNQDMIAPVFCFADIEKNRQNGKLSALLTVEEGGVCKGNLSYLRILYRLGVRMMTLTWNFPNEIGFPNISASCPAFENCGQSYPLESFRTPNAKDGLTETGILFLEEMEQFGMIIDVSHLSDAGFYDVCRYTKKPFVASHSNARSLCSFVRNVTDDMILKTAERGGVIGLNFCPDFLTDISYAGQENQGTIEAIVSHAKHIAKIGGIDCLGIGTDFDGIDGHKEIPNASFMPLLTEVFQKAGFTQSDIDKIESENVLRVYKECLR